ncbi:unnamed protein product [Microthlaspi erraticum]|uniref:C2H2-type domain-containing protein n=1 Tax=Microthlaspi erraticum TaxID=1685480 RepID=A0A6D2HP21_9BRAS|nr:unnamed protein product [Microthlaspi erraticum]
MKRTRDDPSHFLQQSSVYDDDDEYDDDLSSLESGEFQPPSPPPRKHFCVICAKQFSSGKAYGGHVRIHSSEYNTKGKTKKMKMKMKKKRKIGLVIKEKEKETDLMKSDLEGKIRCCLCGKEFQTMHSLFGHMRRHPDRSWKGIRPPPPSEKLKLGFMDNSYDDDDEYEDVMSRSMMMSDVTEDVQEAACILMMIYCAAVEMKKAAMETSNSEVRSSSFFRKGNEKGERGGEMDVDVKIKMEIGVKVNSPQDDEAKRSLGFDLNQPYNEDYPCSYWN